MEKSSETINRINYSSDLIEEYVQNISHVSNKDKETSDFDNVEMGIYSTEHFGNMKERLADFKKLKTDLDKPFKLFIVGSGSYGKSTLINSLLEGDYADTDTLPKTWKMDFYEERTDIDLVKLHYKDGRIEEVKKSKAKKIIEDEENKFTDSKKKISKILKNEMKDNKFDEDKDLEKQIEDRKKQLENEYKYFPQINEVHWGVADAEILKDLILVDTPGLDQDNYSGDVQNDIELYADQSDGIIWMLNAPTIDSRITTTTFSSIHTDNVIAVINKIDAVESEKDVISRAHELYNETFKSIVPYSALNVCHAQEENNSELKKTNGYDELMNVIQKNYVKNATAIQTKRVSQSSTNYNQLTIHEVSAYDDKLLANYNKVIVGSNRIDKLLRDEAKRLKEEFYTLLQNEVRMVIPNVPQYLESAIKIKNKEEQERYLLEQVLKNSKIMSLKRNYSKRASELAQQHYHNVLRNYHITQFKHLSTYKKIATPARIRMTMNMNFKDLNISKPGFFKSALSAGSAGLMFGPMAGLITMGVSSYLNSKPGEESVNKMVSEIEEFYLEIYQEYEKMLDEYYDEVNKSTVDQLESSFANIYNLTAYLQEYDLKYLVQHLREWNNQLKNDKETNNKKNDISNKVMLKAY